MKRLKAGAVNSISFIKNIGYAINSFDVTFEKVVGGTALTLSNLQDNLNLDSCSDFIVLNLDLLSNTIEGGEYYMTISNEGSSTTYLCEVESYAYRTIGSDIYSDSVVLGGPDLTNLSPEEMFASEQVKLFFANDLSSAEVIESTIPFGTSINTNNLDLSLLLDGTIKLYAYSTKAGNYIYWVGTEVLSNPNSFTNVPFAAEFPEPDHYKEVSLSANEVKQIEVFDSGKLYPIFAGINGSELYLQAAITKTDYVKDGNYNAVINPSLDLAPYSYSRQPAWVRNSSYESSLSGARLALCASPINDDL